MGRWIKLSPNKSQYSPYRLKFYEDEHELYSEAYAIKLTQQETRIIFDKLIRHFKIWNISLRFNKRSGGSFNGYAVNLPVYDIQLGLLCHEIAHAIDRKKRGKSKHDKKFMKLIGRVVNYCKKKNYWEAELKKRTEIKVKPVLTKTEIQLKKINKRKNDLIRYEKKLKFYSKLYTNKIKKANRSIMMLERHLESEEK